MMHNNWLVFALGSAVFAALTAICGKVAVANINSNLATFIRTIVILVITALIVTVRGEWEPLSRLSGKATLFLCLSGMATGLSWLCYYRALQLGDASQVAPIDKLSLAFVLLMAWMFLGESMTWRIALGGALMIAGALTVAMK
jgi:transporter family protein